MGNRVRIPPVLDLVGLVGNYGKSIKGLSFAVKVIDTVSTPARYLNKGFSGDFVWKRVGLLWVSVDKNLLRDGCRNASLLAYINNLEDFMSAYGTALVAVPRAVSDGSSIQVRGTLSHDTKTNGSLLLNKWIMSDNDFKVTACDVADIDLRYVPEGLKAVYASVNENSMNDLYKQRIFNIDGLQCALNGRISFGAMPVLTAASVVETGKGGVITARVNEEIAPSIAQINQPQPQISETLGISALGSPNSNTGTAVSPAPLVTPSAQSAEFITYAPSGSTATAVLDAPVVPDERGEYVKNGRTFYNRSELRENIDFISNLDGLVDIAKQRIAILERVVHSVDIRGLDALRFAVSTSIISNFNKKVAPNVGITGYMLMKSVFESVKFDAPLYSFDTDAVSRYNDRATASGDKQLLCSSDLYTETAKHWRWGLQNVLKDKTKMLEALQAWQLGMINSNAVGNVMLAYTDVFLLLIFSKLLKLKLDAYSLCMSGDAISIIFFNPYYLVFLANSPVDILDLDKLAMLAGKFGSQDCNEIRCIAYYHQLLCSERNNLVNCRTMIPMYEIKSRLPYGFCITKAYNSQLLYNKPYALDYNSLSNCMYFLSSVTQKDFFKLPEVNFKEMGGLAVYPWNDIGVDKAVQTYIQSGYGMKLNFNNTDYLADYDILCKELAVYKYCEIISKSPHAKPNGDIAAVIAQFEQSKRMELNDMQFKLEDKQREAVMQVGRPVFAMTGGAGTGKTTTLDAMIFAYEQLFNIGSEDIMLLAPTGKASVRLRKVTKRKTGTIANALITCGSRLKARVIIVDECSMISLDTMFSLLKHIGPETFVIFTGDIAQLLPIGMGKPFANMLKFLPCITLEVSKRALACSNITKNANRLLDLDDTAGFDQGIDFMFVPCSNFDVQNVIQRVVKEEILAQGGISDNIQIVSPMKKEGVDWGTTSLNNSLRNLFNPDSKNTSANRSLVFFKGTKEYRLNIGDRVVHLHNHAKYPRYEVTRTTNGYHLTELQTTGVMNGDIGVLRYIVNSSEATYDTIDIFESEVSSPDTWFALVEYEDVDPSTGDVITYYIKYECEAISPTPLTTKEIQVFENDLSELELAFALTVHKMQGSQADVIIFPVFPLGYLSDFISNNLVYTAWTRAIKKVILVGNVETVMQAKKTLVINRRTSVFDHY